ncbi:uncharacterized protein METZ01_LOCUS482611, partial [marine metagenome]
VADRRACHGIWLLNELEENRDNEPEERYTFYERSHDERIRKDRTSSLRLTRDTLRHAVSDLADANP